jgi:hypothetical protein
MELNDIVFNTVLLPFDHFSTTPSSSIVFEEGMDNGFPIDMSKTSGRLEHIRMTQLRRLDSSLGSEQSLPTGSSSGVLTETSPLRATGSRTSSVEGPRRHSKRLVRQGSTLEAPTDSKGAIKITPWW